jgi:DNA transformation protein
MQRKSLIESGSDHPLPWASGSAAKPAILPISLHRTQEREEPEGSRGVDKLIHRAQIAAMAESAADLAFARDLLSGMGAVETRRMFGGAGIYAGPVMFGLVDEGRIYLKVDDALKAELAAAGAVSWIYTERKGPKAGIPQETSYWSLPESALDDPEEACAWGRRSLAVAEAIKAAGPKRRRGG